VSSSGPAGPDVLVVGGGVVGLFSAYYLRLGGATVTLLERGEVGGPQSSSSGNTGFLGTHGVSTLAAPGMLGRGLRGLLDPGASVSIRPGRDPDLLRWLRQFRRACRDGVAADALDVLLDMKRRGLAAYLELGGDHVRQPGMIIAFRSAGTASGLLSPASLHELEPGVEFSVSGALYNPEGAFVRVPDFIRSFERVLTSMGVTIQGGTSVTGFEARGTRVDAVHTTRGDFRPGAVVLAAGAWSAECVRQLGLRLLVQPVRGYSVTVSGDCGLTRPVVLSEARAAVAPLDGQVRFAGLLEVGVPLPRQAGVSRASGGSGGSAGSARRIAGLRRLAASYLPGLAELPAVDTWTGLRPCTPDGLPYLGFSPRHENLFVAAGHGAIGMGLAPAAGEVAAQALAGKPTAFNLTPFRLNRFNGGPTNNVGVLRRPWPPKPHLDAGSRE
jgi:D-amino-acid dehydrogenase